MHAATLTFFLATAVVLSVTAAPLGLSERDSESVASRVDIDIGENPPVPMAQQTPPPWRKGNGAHPSSVLESVAQPTPPPWKRESSPAPNKPEATPVGDAPGW
ncbi:hypothetical protein DFH09DRAFT_1308484 [Mycena vulgaris]|nr:hypothetical protein DFH09DRAFT_1308484 [Mycena vulgaris]